MRFIFEKKISINNKIAIIVLVNNKIILFLSIINNNINKKMVLSN